MELRPTNDRMLGAEDGRRKRLLRRAVMGWCGAALVASAVLAVAGGIASRSGAATSTSPYFTFSVTPTQNLFDGEELTVTVTRTAAGTAAGAEILRVEPGWCAAGTKLPTSISATPYGPGTDFPTGIGKTVLCTTDTYPLNADPQPISTISPDVKATGNYTTVTGPTFAQSTGGTALRYGTIVCDATSPCTFALAVYAKIDTKVASTHAIFFLETQVMYEPTSVEAACGGAAPGQLTTVAPDRLGSFASTATRGACEAQVGGGKALGEVLSSGKSDAQSLCAFASGRADLAYSAVGYGTSKSSFNPWNCTVTTGGPQPQRPYIAIPIALNSVDIAHTQTAIVNNASNSDSFKNYPQLDINEAQAASLISTNGAGLWSFSLGQAILKENPTLADDFFYFPSRPLNHNNLVSGVDGPVVTSGTQATTYFATEFLHALAAKTMTSPTTGSPALGVVSNFSTAVPRFAVDSVTGLVNIVHALTPSKAFGGMPFALLSGSDSDAVWFGMDAMAFQTPSSIGHTPVYVAPSTGSMQAAVPTMTQESDGTLVPNPHAAATSTPAYPLTYVEYAIAPAQPLETTGCNTPRTTSQTDLTDWLNYLIGPEQQDLPAGMAPLTSTLLSQAQGAVAKVGASPCAPVPPPPAKTTTTTVETPHTSPSSQTGSSSGQTGAGSAENGSGTGTGGFGTGTFTGGGTTFGQGSSGSTSSTSGASTTSSGKSSSPSNTSTTTHVPSAQPVITADLARLVVRTGSSWLLPAAGVVFLFALLPGLALFISGRPSRHDLARIAAAAARARPWGRRKP